MQKYAKIHGNMRNHAKKGRNTWSNEQTFSKCVKCILKSQNHTKTYAKILQQCRTLANMQKGSKTMRNHIKTCANMQKVIVTI